MKAMILSTLGATLLFVAMPAFGGGEVPTGFKPLFNGKNLSGWWVQASAKPVWGAENGVIYCSGGGGGWLMTADEYGDFELRLEYKLPKGGNSGVGLRSPLVGDPAYAGMELQLIDDEGWPGKLQNWQNTGSIYNVVPAKTIKNKTIGEWNDFRVIAKGRKITVTNNGETIVDANLAEYEKEHGKKHPGILRAKGHIGLQSYNLRVEYRNIYLKPL